MILEPTAKGKTTSGDYVFDEENTAIIIANYKYAYEAESQIKTLEVENTTLQTELVIYEEKVDSSFWAGVGVGTGVTLIVTAITIITYSLGK